MNSSLTASVAATAARLVVQEGMDYPRAKYKAARELGKRGARSKQLPSTQEVEDEVRAFISLYCCDTQAHELRVLRTLAAQWMWRLAEFRPYLTGAVWRGTATRLSCVDLELYCDDPKSAQIALVNQGTRFLVDRGFSPRGADIAVLIVFSPCPELGGRVALTLSLLDHDDLRGSAGGCSRGNSVRGNLSALRNLIASG